MEYEGIGFDYKKLLKRKYILHICLALCFLTSSFFYFNERYQAVRSTKATTTVKKMELKNIMLYKNQHPDIEDYKKCLEKENEITSLLLPEKYEEKDFLKSLNQLSKSVKIVNVTLPTKQDVIKLKQDNVYVYYSKIQIQGDYYDILRLFKDLEEQHYLLQNIKMKADKTGYLEASLKVGKFILASK